MNCPFCEQPLAQPDAVDCQACGQTVEPPELHRYDAPLEALDEAVGRMASGQVPPALAPTLFVQLLGSVQQVLDHAREDLQQNLRRLSAVPPSGPEEASRQPLEFILAFEELQGVLNAHMTALHEVFHASTSVLEFERQRPKLDAAMSAMRAALGDLEALERTTSDPLLAAIADEPLPEEISISIHQFELAMGAMGQYCDLRERAMLQKCLRHLDEARGRIKQVLLVEAFHSP